MVGRREKGGRRGKEGKNACPNPHVAPSNRKSNMGAQWMIVLALPNKMPAPQASLNLRIITQSVIECDDHLGEGSPENNNVIHF